MIDERSTKELLSEYEEPSFVEWFLRGLIKLAVGFAIGTAIIWATAAIIISCLK